MLENNEFPEVDQPQVTDISHTDVSSVHAEIVRMHQADAELITADEVELQNSAAGNVKAANITGHMVLMGAVSADEVSVQNGGLGFVQAGKVSVSGYTGAVVAGSVEVHQAMSGFVAGREVHVSESRMGLLFARNVHGDVTTVLDTRGALIAGLTGGLFAGLMLLLGRVLFRRK
jgi:CHASE2 domain-containing sensor protein